jgi:hypothetical protein
MKTHMMFGMTTLLAVTLAAGGARAESPANGKQIASRDPNEGESSVMASDDVSERDQTLQTGKISHGGYGGPELKMTSVSSTAAMLVGGQGGWIIGHSLTLGGAGYGLATRVDAPDQAPVQLGDARVQLGYGGIRVGYTFTPHKLFHFSTGLLIGAGGVAIVEHHNDGSDNRLLRSNAVFALEPDVAVELNINWFMRAGISASYRYLGDSRIAGLSAGSLSAPAAGAVIKFGAF